MATRPAAKAATRRSPLLTAANARYLIYGVIVILSTLVIYNPLPIHLSLRGAMFAIIAGIIGLIVIDRRARIAKAVNDNVTLPTQSELIGPTRPVAPASTRTERATGADRSGPQI